MDSRRRVKAAVSSVLLILLAGCVSVTSPAPVESPTPAQAPPAAVKTPLPATSPAPTPEPQRLPQIDSSTARIPITEAIYKLFKGKGYAGPGPICSKTHGAWLNLADGKADIVFLVAPTKDELAYFAEKSVDIEMKVYGFDGLVFMGNRSNPVQNLTSKQIRDIYSGKIKNWKSVGGENADILVYIRDPESGSQRLFGSLVWEGYDMPDFSALHFRQGEIDSAVVQRSTSVIDDMGEVTRNVLLNQYAIGFNIMSYIDSEFASSSLKLFSVDGCAPTTENFASGLYPFLTTSYVAIRAGEPEDSPARQLYDWVGSEESRGLIAENSTLTVSFSDSVSIKVSKADASSPGQNELLAETIGKLDQTFLTRQELFPFTPDEIGYLRNGVYALSGKLFKTKIYAQYFRAQSWYKGTSASDGVITKKFNQYQTYNLELIHAYEAELKRALAN